MAEARYTTDVVRKYEGEGIVVTWEPSLCIHTANCIRTLPAAFDPNARPWIDVTKANVDALAGAVMACPTGALGYARTDGVPEDEPARPTAIHPRRNGPLYVDGDFEVLDAEGGVLRSARRVALCRCGESANKPFCDLAHRAMGFRA